MKCPSGALRTQHTPAVARDANENEHGAPMQEAPGSSPGATTKRRGWLGCPAHARHAAARGRHAPRRVSSHDRRLRTPTQASSLRVEHRGVQSATAAGAPWHPERIEQRSLLHLIGQLVRVVEHDVPVCRPAAVARETLGRARSELGERCGLHDPARAVQAYAERSTRPGSVCGRSQRRRARGSARSSSGRDHHFPSSATPPRRGTARRARGARRPLQPCGAPCASSFRGTGCGPCPGAFS